MYLVTNHHDPIIDRDTYNRVQQELARRNSKRKISDKTVTEQGKYSSKYALSELLICGHCGTPYRRTTWAARGKKQIVWRCLSRLEHGKKYCPDSPTIKEEQLHRGILRAINNYYSCRNDIVRILKANIGSVLECQGQEEILSVEKRLKEIDQARTDLVNLIWFCQYHLTHFIRTRIMQRERYDHSRAFFGLPEADHRWRCRFFCWPSNS